MAEEYGLKTFLDTADFNKGLSEFLRGIGQYTDALLKADNQGQKGAQGVSAIDAAMAAASGGASLLATAVGNILANAFSSLVGSVQSATSAIVEFGTQSLAIAGRVDELTRAAMFLGQQQGFTSTEVQGFLDGLEEVGIRADVSATLIAQLARYQVDLAKSTDLATVAQNAAVLAGIDSSEALESLNHAAVTSNALVARNAGLTVDFTAAQERFAESMGKSRDELTEAQKIQSNYNAILAEGAKISGVYTVAMESPTKAIRSLGREIYNLQAALGAPFLQAWSTVIGIVRDFVQDLTTAVQEGGVLYPILINLGAAASLMADGLAYGAEAVKNFVFQLVENMTGTIQNFLPTVLRLGSEIIAELASGIIGGQLDVFIGIAQIGTTIFEQLTAIAGDAVSYGAEIVVSIAEGIIEAATTVLVAAMNYVGSILSFWLAPGSPPRVAPDLDKWGADAMAEWLRGFTQTDFNVLNSLESQLQSALGEKGLAGLMDELLQAVDAGEVTADLFDAIAAASGAYGDELAILVQNEVAYAAALEQANAASEALVSSQSKVAQLQAEYNDLLRQGADKATLQAKLDQINAAEREVEAAKEQGKAAAENLDDLENQAAIQKEIVKQLTKLAKAQERAGAGGGGGGGGGIGKGAGLGAGLDLFGGGAGIDPNAISTRIAEAIETAKQNLLNTLTGENSPFAPLFDAWNNDILPRIETLKTTLFGGINEIGEPVKGLIPTFQEFATEVSLAWDNVQTKFEEAKTFISEKITEISTSWETFKTNIGTATDTVNTKLGEMQGFFGTLTETFNTVTLPAFDAFYGILDSIAQVVSTVLTEAWEQILLPVLQTVWDFVDTSINPLFQALADLLEATVTTAINIMTGVWETYCLPILQDIVGVLEDVEEWFGKVADIASITVGPALETLATTILDPLRQAFDDIAEAVEWVITQIGNLAEAIRNLPSLPSVPGAYEGHSPPPLAYWLGDIAAAAEMVGKEMQAVNAAFAPGRVTVPASPAAPQSAGGGSSYTDARSASFQIGSINTPMEQASFEAMADRWWSDRSQGRSF